LEGSIISAELTRVALRTPHGLLACGFGSGLAPKAPGTFGSLAALLPWWLWMADLPLPVYAGLLVVAFAVGVWVCGLSGKALGKTDHGAIVWDEFVGVWLTLFAVAPEWPQVLAGLLLFRFFDILKPPPIRTLEKRLPGGLGVMADDVLAAVFAALALQAGLMGWARLFG
jgi:phosphatidylglycerophosphatase A